MSQVGQTGSTQNQQVDYSGKSEAASDAKSTDKIGAGTLDQQNIRFADQQVRNKVLQGQTIRAPELPQPGDVKPTAMESASRDVDDLSKSTEAAFKNAKILLEAAKNGTLSPEQQAQLRKHANTLQGTADYLKALHGQGLGSNEGKKSVLEGMGFNKSQLDALLSLANPDDAGNSLASMHGGQAALQGKKDALSSMGFSEGQIEALLSLANPDDDGNALASFHQSGSAPKKALAALGFSDSQADRFLALRNGQKATQGSAEQRQLLAKMGYDDGAIDVLLSAADPKSLLQQNSLIKGTSAQQADDMQDLAETIFKVINGNGTGNNILKDKLLGDAIVKQLVDIFAVMELLHEMSVNARRKSRETRAIEYDSARQETLNQAEEMKSAAVKTLVAGVVSGSAKMAAGAVTGAGAAGGKSHASPGADATAQTQAKSVALQQSMQKATSVSQLVNASGEMASAGFNYQASLHSAKQKEHEAMQKTHENAAQSASEFMQLHQDMIKTVQSKMSEIINSWYETLKTTTRG